MFDYRAFACLWNNILFTFVQIILPNQTKTFPTGQSTIWLEICKFHFYVAKFWVFHHSIKVREKGKKACFCSL